MAEADRGTARGLSPHANDLAQFYDAIFESELAVYVLRIGENGRPCFQDANRVVGAIAGRDVADIRGRAPADCLPGPIAECLEDNFFKCLRTGEGLAYEKSLELPLGKVAFRTNLIPVPGSQVAELVVGITRDISEDVSERDRTQQEVRDLSQRLLTLQFDERRAIAQELHDSTGQHLAVIGMALARAQAFAAATADSSRLDEAIHDARSSLEAVHRETRVLSYLLHPVELASKSLRQAIESFSTGFANRAGFRLDLKVSPEADSLSDELSLNLLRICQEALTNIYRHADASGASIVLESDGENIILAVADDGVGFDMSSLRESRASGLGLSGMRERVKRLGGSITVSRREKGTELTVSVPRHSSRGVDV